MYLIIFLLKVLRNRKKYNTPKKLLRFYFAFFPKTLVFVFFFCFVPRLYLCFCNQYRIKHPFHYFWIHFVSSAFSLMESIKRVKELSIYCFNEVSLAVINTVKDKYDVKEKSMNLLTVSL